jgi:methylmalonyl-CoA mutase
MSTQSPAASNPFDCPPSSPDEAEWRRRVAAVLKGAPADTLVATISENLTIAPLHAQRRDVEPLAGRGPRPWRVTQRVDHPDAEAALRQVHDDLLNGADALSLVFPEARAARGFGLAVETSTDLDHVLNGVELDMIGLRLDGGAQAPRRAAEFASLVQRRSLDPACLEVDFGLDPLGSIVDGGTSWPDAADTAMRCVSTLVERGFNGPILRADGRLWHEAGASDVDELACLCATLTTYMRLLESHGYGLDDARGMLSVVVAADQDQFVTMARIRALRLLWAAVERGSGLAPRPLAIHAETSWRMMTRGDPLNNVLRASLATAAAGLAGADGITVLAHTMAHGLPDADARRLARSVSLALLAEGHLAKVEDPAAGAGAIEALTDALAEQAWARFQALEAKASEQTPGIVAALRDGTLSARIESSRSARAQSLALRSTIITGVTAFPPERERPVVVDRPMPQPDKRARDALLSSIRLEDLVA